MNIHDNGATTLSHLTPFHSFVSIFEKITALSILSVVFHHVLFVTALLFAFLGLLFLLHTLNSHRTKGRKIFGLLICGIIIALAGAFGNLFQAEMATIGQNNMLGVLVGGALGGLITAGGDGITDLLDKLSRLHLVYLGAFLIFLGFSLEFAQIILILKS